ncbi:MAG: hypothetical protein ACHQAW_05090 [Actinomycetota bacterium]
MDVRAGGKGSAWKLCIGLAVLCGVLVFAAGFLHRNAVASAIDAQQTKSVSYVRGKLATAVGNDKLTKELGDRAAADLKKEADVPAGTDVRLYALDGTPVFSSGRPGAGDRAAITAAAEGEIGRVVDGSDLVVYASIENKGGKPIAVAAVISDIDAVRADAAGPLDGLRLPLVALGVVLLVAGLVLMVRGGSTPGAVRAKGDDAVTTKAPKASKEPKEAAPGKSRVSGFSPAPALVPASESAPDKGPDASASVEVESPPAPARKGLRLGRKTPKDAAVLETSEERVSAPKVKKSLFGRSQTSRVVPEPADEPESPMTPDREAAILRMLEDQLEQLRMKIKTQEETAASATRQLQEELDAATRRANEAEARVGSASDAPLSVGPAERDMIERLRSLETELAQAKATAADAVAQAGELQRTVDAASPGPQAASGPVDTAELAEVRARLAAAEEQVEEAQRLAAEAEQRAASNESVRGELEVRVAQLGAKAGELEQKATELETRLQEANAGGDAVRAETAALTAALAGATARVEELESVAPSGPQDLDASAAEVTRLRAELASQMERAQAAEDRGARLEADVAAAEHGVRTTDETLDETPDDVHPAPLERVEVTTPTVWVAPSVAAPQLEEETPAPQPTVQTEPAPGTDGGPERDGFSEVFAAAFGNEDESSPVRESNGSVEPAPTADPPVAATPSASLPEAPNGDDRYGDVWSEPADEPDKPDKPQEPAVQAPAAMTSSLDDEPAPAADEAAPAADAPAKEDESVSVEDDLWALRARLAHAADDRDTQHTPTDEPRWS